MAVAKKKQTNPGRLRAAERTREEILLAAARACAKGGVQSIRMEDIAREAGYTGPALYSYFKSKAEIFEALAATVKQQMQETLLQPLPPGLGFRQKVNLVVYRQLEIADRWRDLFVAHLMLREVKSKPTREEARVILGHIAGWLAREGGEELGGHDPDEVAILLMSITHGFFVRWLLQDTPGRLMDSTERIVSFFFDGLNGSGPAAASSEVKR